MSGASTSVPRNTPCANVTDLDPPMQIADVMGFCFALDVEAGGVLTWDNVGTCPN